MTHTRAVSTEFVPVLQFVSSSAESGNSRIWNPTTVAIFGMIGTLSAHKPITVCCTALQTALSGRSRVVFCNCRDSGVGIIAEFRINYGFGKIWTQSGPKTAINGNEKCLQIMSVHHDSVRVQRRPSRQHRT